MKTLFEKLNKYYHKAKDPEVLIEVDKAVIQKVVNAHTPKMYIYSSGGYVEAVMIRAGYADEDGTSVKFEPKEN